MSLKLAMTVPISIHPLEAFDKVGMTLVGVFGARVASYHGAYSRVSVNAPRRKGHPGSTLGKADKPDNIVVHDVPDQYQASTTRNSANCPSPI